jgi:DNA-directed RNA polymerase subunit RPC12/RpoP
MIEEYINKGKLIEEIRKAASRSMVGEISEPYLDWKTVVSFIFDAPAEAVVPTRYGKWIPASTKPGVHAGMKCSECKARISYSEHFNGQHLYCHKCGAKMIKEKDPEYTFRTYAGVPGYEATDKE